MALACLCRNRQFAPPFAAERTTSDATQDSKRAGQNDKAVLRRHRAEHHLEQPLPLSRRAAEQFAPSMKGQATHVIRPVQVFNERPCR
jgi:hypothetical protein